MVASAVYSRAARRRRLVIRCCQMRGCYEMASVNPYERWECGRSFAACRDVAAARTDRMTPLSRLRRQPWRRCYQCSADGGAHVRTMTTCSLFTAPAYSYPNLAGFGSTKTDGICSVKDFLQCLSTRQRDGGNSYEGEEQIFSAPGVIQLQLVVSRRHSPVVRDCGTQQWLMPVHRSSLSFEFTRKTTTTRPVTSHIGRLNRKITVATGDNRQQSDAVLTKLDETPLQLAWFVCSSPPVRFTRPKFSAYQQASLASGKCFGVSLRTYPLTTSFRHRIRKPSS